MISDLVFFYKKVGSLHLGPFNPLLTVRSDLIPQMSQCDLQDEVKTSSVESTG
jgi:hypothetical protein